MSEAAQNVLSAVVTVVSLAVFVVELRRLIRNRRKDNEWRNRWH